ncbi:MAG: T9SS type A sorting domain-containing protein, partial [Flavobacteriales bacterium]
LNNGYQAAAMNNGFLLCPSQMMLPDEPPIEDGDLVDAMMLIAPNPTRGITSVLLPAAAADAALQVELRDATGALVQMIATGSVQAGAPARIEFDTDGLPAGLYLCIARIGDQQLHGRLVVE